MKRPRGGVVTLPCGCKVARSAERMIEFCETHRREHEVYHQAAVESCSHARREGAAVDKGGPE